MSGNETDWLALLEIKARITADPHAVLTSWNETMHFCTWHRVTCSRRHQRVTMWKFEFLARDSSGGQ
ncbi:unnamed protein product [Prunus armeniaca]